MSAGMSAVMARMAEIKAAFGMSSRSSTATASSSGFEDVLREASSASGAASGTSESSTAAAPSARNLEDLTNNPVARATKAKTGMTATSGPSTDVANWPDAVPEEAKQFASQFIAASKETGVPLEVLLAVTWAESAFRPGAESSVGAQGLMQLMPGTAAGLGVDPSDPTQNILGGARYLAQQYESFGSWDLAFAAYNAGPGAVQKYGGIPPYRETQNYVNIINGYLDRIGSMAPASVPATAGLVNQLAPVSGAEQAAPVAATSGTTAAATAAVNVSPAVAAAQPVADRIALPGEVGEVGALGGGVSALPGQFAAAAAALAADTGARPRVTTAATDSVTIDPTLWSPAVLQRNLAEAVLSTDASATPTAPSSATDTEDAAAAAPAQDAPAPATDPLSRLAALAGGAPAPAVALDQTSPAADGSAVVAAASRLAAAPAGTVAGAAVRTGAELDDSRSSTLSAPAIDGAGPLASPLDALAANARSTAATIPTAGDAARTGAVPVAAMPERITALVERGRENGQTTHKMTVRLDPPDLGLVSVHFELKDGAVSVLLRPERAEAGTLLTSQRERVAEALQREGLNLAGFDVRTDSGGTDRGGQGRTYQGRGANAPANAIDADRPAETQLTLERELRL